MTRILVALVVLAGAARAQDTKIPSPGSGQPIPAGVPALPVSNPKAEFDKLPPNLQTHLLAWERTNSGMQTLYTDCERELTNLLTKKSTKWKGSIRCMKPNLAYLRMDNLVKKDDFEAFICDGKSVYNYVGADKIVRQHLIPPGGKAGVGDNLLLEFMSGGMTAVDIAGRFKMKLLKEDQYYIYLEVLPVLNKDLKEFDSLILVLYASGVKGMEYLPAKVQMKLNNGQAVDEWTFKQPMVNPAGIKAADFSYITPPKDWQVKPADPTVRP